MIQDKGLAVSAALDLLAASEILSCFELQEKLISIQFGPASRKTCCLRLLLCSRSALVSSFLLFLFLCLSLSLFLCLPPCSRKNSFPCAVLVGANISDLNGPADRHRPCCKSAAGRSCCHPTAEAAVSICSANERRSRLLVYPSAKEDSRSARCSSCSST
jgi:hypothetical protein